MESSKKKRTDLLKTGDLLQTRRRRRSLVCLLRRRCLIKKIDLISKATKVDF